MRASAGIAAAGYVFSFRSYSTSARRHRRGTVAAFRHADACRARHVRAGAGQERRELHTPVCRRLRISSRWAATVNDYMATCITDFGAVSLVTFDDFAPPVAKSRDLGDMNMADWRVLIGRREPRRRRCTATSDFTESSSRTAGDRLSSRSFRPAAFTLFRPHRYHVGRLSSCGITARNSML